MITGILPSLSAHRRDLVHAESTSMEEDTSGNEGDGSWAEESTGVLDRLMDDVERGADDLMDGTGAGGSAAADEGTR